MTRSVWLPTLVRSPPSVVICPSGYRAAIAASVLTAARFHDVSTVLGGIEARGAAGPGATDVRGDERT